MSEPVVEKVLTEGMHACRAWSEEDVTRDLRRYQKKLRQIGELQMKASQGVELE